jgi:hypothetical protein
MPFALVLIGLALVVTSAQDTYVQLGRQLRSDFTGQGSFIYWAGAIGMAGAIGYVDALRKLSVALLVLVLKHSDFFSKFTTGIKQGPSHPTKTGTGSSDASNSGQGKSPISAIIPFSSAIPGVDELPNLPNLADWAAYAKLAL